MRNQGASKSDPKTFKNVDYLEIGEEEEVDVISNESIQSIFLANQYIDENMGRDDIINL